MRRLISKLKKTKKKKNIIPKIVCVMLAFVLWAYLSEKNVGERQFRIPLIFENLPSNMAMSNIPIKQVSILVQGNKELLQEVQTKNISAVVNMKSPKVGTAASYPIQIIKKDMPESLSVTLKQESVDILVERKISKLVRVVPVMTGAVADGFVIGGIRVKPNRVQIVGAKSIVDNITSLSTDDISVTGAERDIIVNTPLKKDSAGGVEFKENSVQVTVTIGKSGAFFNIVRRIMIKNPPKEYEFSFPEGDVVTIYIAGQSSVELDNNIEASVDVSSLKLGEILKDQQKAAVTLPINVTYKNNLSDIEIVSISPEEITITVAGK